MSLQSFGFFGFLLVVAAVYLHLPQRWQSAFLLAASWVFYALAMPSMLPVTIAIAVFTYLCGCGMTAREGARKTAFLRIGVAGLLAILAFFKYNGAFASDGGWQAVAMPLGISFYSFAAISYLIDAARGDCEVEKNFIDCALFLNFFATVTQGPICRAGALLPQFKEEHRFDAARTVRALRLMALGLFKLVAVSDVLGLLVDEVFSNYRSYGGPMLVLAAVFYTFQLYFNFSGYSEVARAVGLLLGLELPENFKTPFFATNFSGFWSRWHISFSSWLQDYLFMPLAWADVSGLTGGKISRLPAEFCVFTVFFVSGFWHGNTLPFVVWGLLQASYRLGEELLHRRLGKPKKKAPARVLWAKRAGVFVLWCVSMVFFRVGSSPAAAPLTVGDAFAYLGRCFMGWAPRGLRRSCTPPRPADFTPTPSWSRRTTALLRWCWRWRFTLTPAGRLRLKTSRPKSAWPMKNAAGPYIMPLSSPCWQAISCRAVGLGAADLVCTRGSDSCAVGARHASPAAFPSDVIYRQVAGRACPAPTFYKN